MSIDKIGTEQSVLLNRYSESIHLKVPVNEEILDITLHVKKILKRWQLDLIVLTTSTEKRKRKRMILASNIWAEVVCYSDSELQDGVKYFNLRDLLSEEQRGFLGETKFLNIYTAPNGVSISSPSLPFDFRK